MEIESLSKWSRQTPSPSTSLSSWRLNPRISAPIGPIGWDPTAHHGRWSILLGLISIDPTIEALSFSSDFCGAIPDPTILRWGEERSKNENPCEQNTTNCNYWSILLVHPMEIEPTEDSLTSVARNRLSSQAFRQSVVPSPTEGNPTANQRPPLV